VLIHSHFNGPIGSGHGGVAAGLFATLVEPAAASVRFMAPIPLDTPLDARSADGTVTFSTGSIDVARVQDLAAPLQVAPFALPSVENVLDAEPAWLDFRDGEHMAPTCFACGHDRSEGGLGLRPGRTVDPSVRACTWTPEGDGRVPSWMVWAALDCPTGVPALQRVGRDQAVVTGELSVQILRPVPAGVTHRILSRYVAESGRRHQTEAALFDPEGRRLAIATATWITVPMAAVIPTTAAATA
jgi:acyl-coenzyme A thioesterase PaaI-like protein